MSGAEERLEDRAASVAAAAAAAPGDGAGYEAMRWGAAALELARDVVRVAGPDAERYLQGQLSQDVVAIAEGQWAWSLVLQPQGKLVAFVRAYRVGTQEFLLDTDEGMGPALVERLLRFRLRTKADVEQLPWRAVAVRGPAATPLVEGAGAGVGASVPFAWNGFTGYDLLGPSLSAPAGIAVAALDAYEAARIEAGFPLHGAELDDRTIPAEAGLVEACVSFAKGCYTGQELVARIDSRGSNVPRRLRGILLEATAEPGDQLLEAASASAKVVGKLTSVARSPRLGWVALGYVSRGVEVGQTVYVEGGQGPLAGEVRPLPLAPKE